jgi:hypothetical protein
MFKLYKELPREGKRGPRGCAPNAGLQIGLQESMIGNTKARVILASTNTPPPGRTPMQRKANKVGDITTKLNQEDLDQRLIMCKETNRLRGLPEDTPINISVDVRYDTNTFSSRRKMGQNATQAIGLATENQSDKHQIVAMHMDNKLCRTGSWLRNRGFDVNCPDHADCTATQAPEEPFSERHIGVKLGESIGQHIMVKHVTTDGDGRSAEGIEIAMQQLQPLWRVIRQADTTHLGQGQFGHTLKATFSANMFSGTTKVVKRDQQKILGLDLKNRCHIIFQQLYDTHGGSIKDIASRIPKVLDATIRCYAGDCSKCRRHSLVCSGGKRRNWWNRSIYLHTAGIRYLSMTNGDKKLLENLMKLRISVEALETTKLNTNTNCNEGYNRGLSASLPKNVSFSRNAAARAHAAVHRMNWGHGESLLRKLQAVGSPVTKGGFVAASIKSLQQQSVYNQKYTKTKLAKVKMLRRKATQIKAFYKAKHKSRIAKLQQDGYRKGQLDPIPGTSGALSQIPKKRVPNPRRRVTAVLKKVRKRDHTYAVFS